MTGLLRQLNLGDITFGLNADIPLLHSPWGYYKYLGIGPTATRDEIDRAYKSKAKKVHSDLTHGSDDEFKTLRHVVSILLDDGGNLGPEHSRRRHYDQICTLDSYFDGSIELDGERTKRLSEIMLINLELEKRRAEVEVKIEEKFPEFKELKEKLEEPISERQKDIIIKKLQKMVDETLDITPEIKKEAEKNREKQSQEFQKQQLDFLEKFRSNQQQYFSYILDVLYVGDEKVTFGTNREKTQIRMMNHEIKGKILELILGGTNYITGFSKVHFKAQEGIINIYDENIEGLVHVVNGRINLSYNASTYGSVIRARSPNTINRGGFSNRGELYVPQRFAKGKWWEKKPRLELAVKNGEIELELTTPELGKGKIISPYSSIEELLKNSFKNNIYKNDLNKIIYK